MSCRDCKGPPSRLFGEHCHPRLNNKQHIANMAVSFVFSIKELNVPKGSYYLHRLPDKRDILSRYRRRPIGSIFDDTKRTSLFARCGS